ncbi:SDR family oxidoreductase, partial [Bradyrhizobium sp. Leaf401]|uniref:SDR family oxidoreductase n=1 Tax=Bradyrhizobium sp. Leaf401 TaxID=2876564 RepID=UPI001E39176A
IVAGADAVEVHVELLPEEDGAISFEIYSGSGDAQQIHSQGQVAVGAAPADRGVVDLNALRAQCTSSVSAAECYEAFSGVGISYGPAHQGLAALSCGADEQGHRQVLAELKLPSCVSATADQYVLHPSLLDSALQASVGLSLGSQANQNRPLVPFAVDDVEVLGRCPRRLFAWLRWSAGSGEESAVRKVDIDVCDEAGQVCVRLRGFSFREFETGVTQAASEAFRIPQSGSMTFAPIWEVNGLVQAEGWPGSDRVVIVGGTAARRAEVRRRWTAGTDMEIPADADIEAIRELLQSQGAIDHILWLAPGETIVPDAEFVEEQARGVLQCFRMIKALLELGYDKRTLGWTVITTGSQAVRRDDDVNPSHASVHGLFGTVAKEYAQWQIRLVDLPPDGTWPLAELSGLPADPEGNAWAYRERQWYRQRLVPSRLSSGRSPSLYKQGGVYVVIGGAGGIGEAWSEYMIRSYQARIVWIGRRKKDEAVQAKLDRLAALGVEPAYIEADAGDEASLTRAYETIKARHGQIHGVVHSALVLRDKSLANMDEATFVAALSAKVDVSVRMAQVFGREALDFVLFFSSMQSFSRAAGQSNYASGCNFADAFAH